MARRGLQVLMGSMGGEGLMELVWFNYRSDGFDDGIADGTHVADWIKEVD